LPFIESELDPGVFTDCVLVHDYLDLLNAHGVPHDESLRARLRSKTYVLSEFINPSWSERREIDFKHYNDWRKERFRKYFAGYGIADYRGFFTH
jgi:hypothetical protein